MTSNRISPAFINKNNKRQRRFSVPNTVAESFEWFAKGGKEANSRDVPVFLVILTFVSFALILVPWQIFKFAGITVERSDLIANELNEAFDHKDVIRTSLVLGIGMLVGVVTMAVLHFITVLIKNSHRRDQTLKTSAQKTLETIKFMGPYISMTFMAMAASFMVKHFYPNIIGIARAIKASDPATATATEGDVNAALSLLMKVLDNVLTFGKSAAPLYFKVVFPAIINTISVLAFVLTFEKFILQMIAVSYRTATTAGRFTENAFALSVIKALLRNKLEMSGGIKPGHIFNLDHTNSLFDAIVDHDNSEENGASEIMKLHHLENCMDPEQAVKLFGILDVAQNGDLTKDEFLSGVKAIYDEQETLTKLVSDHDGIIAKLDEIMLFVVYAIDFALCLNFLGIDGVAMLKTAIGLLIAFALFFSDALNKLIDSLIFVLITHPYDLGDRVEIEGKYLYVESVGLWTTTFNGPGGLKTIMTNASISDDKIGNFRRSPAENEIFSYLVRPETVTAGSVEALRKDCMQFFKDHNRDFLPNWHLETSDQIDTERFKIILKVFHRHNFQNEEEKNERSQKLALFLKDALIRNGFAFSPAYPKAMAAVL